MASWCIRQRRNHMQRLCFGLGFSKVALTEPILRGKGSQGSIMKQTGSTRKLKFRNCSVSLWGLPKCMSRKNVSTEGESQKYTSCENVSLEGESPKCTSRENLSTKGKKTEIFRNLLVYKKVRTLGFFRF